ncbi:YusW family protein [Ornithinibacillus contaminans]|uniref:YusW family protein n=1 Tax=Ornithinibacillus contaminans TaxID=694055 RepID=UPI00064D8154|nr:YusW family protein [Ornithinibacillus contaminans]
MRKIELTFLLLLTAFMITACGDADDSTANLPTDTDSESQPAMNADDLVERMQELDYTVIDFDVLYADSEFEGEIASDGGLIEAELYDPTNDMNARGRAAFDAMFPFAKSLEVHYDMTDTEAIAASLETFNLPDNYLKAVLEVEFKDGMTKTFEVKNHEM